MSIDNISSSYSLPGGAGDARFSDVMRVSAKPEETVFDISDGFAHMGDAPDIRSFSSLSAADLNSVVLNTKGIEKGQFRFRVRSQEQGPDGTMFIAYNDWEKKNGNYISAVNRDGTVKWEARVGDNGLEDLRVGPDGTVYARTKDELVAFDGDGQQKFRHKFECEIKDHWIDAKGNNVFRQSMGNGLYIVDAGGKRVELPQGLKDLAPNEVKVTPDGAFWCRQGNTITKADPTGGSKEQVFTFEDPAEKKCSPDTFYPAPDGGVYVKGEYVNYIPPPDYGDLHVGLRHGHHFGGHFFGGPHMGAFDDIPQGTTWTDNYIFKLGKDGKIQWKSEKIGSHPAVETTSAGDLFIYDSRTNTNGKYEIKKMTPEGTTGGFTEFDNPVDKFAVRQKDDHLFAQSGKTLKEFAPDGAEVGSKSLDGPEGYKFHGFDNDGNVLLTDKDSIKLYSMDAQTGDITKLTDHEKDYSYRVTLKQAEKLDSTGVSEQTPVIEQGDDHVNVDGVELTKKKKKKIF